MVEFYATWCGHCQRMMPIVAQVRELVGDNAQIYQLDIDRYNDVANEAGVDATPTFIIYRNGEPVWRHAGEIEGNELLKTLEGFMN